MEEMVEEMVDEITDVKRGASVQFYKKNSKFVHFGGKKTQNSYTLVLKKPKFVHFDSR